MKVNAILTNLLSNKMVLQFIFFLSLTNIVGYLIYGMFDVVVYFILIGLLVSYFSKNMIVILGIPLFLVNLSVLGKAKFKEGLENKDKTKSTKTTNKTDEAKKEDHEIISPIDDTPTTEHVDPETKASLGKTGFEVGRNKNKSKYKVL